MAGERITLVISSLGAGGAERILIWLANSWQEAGRHVSVVTLADADQQVAYPLHPQVELHPLGICEPSCNRLHGLWNNLKRLPVLRRKILSLRPDLVVSFMDRTNVRVLLVLIGSGIPVIVSEHTNPDYLQERSWRALRRMSYRWAAGIAVLTRRTGEKLGMPAKQWQVIPNPVRRPESGRQPSPLALHRPVLVGVGRLVEMKRFALLIELFAELAKDFPHWQLLIMGEGPERKSLQQLVERLGVSERVSLPGYMDQPDRVLNGCDLFVLCSRFEGFPMALCEALASGLPAVAFDCPTGPREILRHGVDGLLVANDDRQALKQALRQLMGDAALRQQMALRAPEICERFSPERVFALWNRLANDALGRPRTE